MGIALLSVLCKVFSSILPRRMKDAVRPYLDQRLIAMRSLIILYNHIRSKTRLITIMNLIATLGIIYTSLHNRGLSEYQLSLPPHRACYYIQTGHGDRGKVGSSCSSSAFWVCVV